MSTPKQRRRITVGDRVRVDGADHIVIGVTGPRVRLADDTGAVLTVTVIELLTDPRFDLVDTRAPVVPRPEVGLEGLPAAAARRRRGGRPTSSRWCTGCRRTPRAGARPKPQYDPERTSLTAREKAKAAELSAAGRAGAGQHAQAPPAAVGGPRPGRVGGSPGGEADVARPGGWTSGWRRRCGRRSRKPPTPPPAP